MISLLRIILDYTSTTSSTKGRLLSAENLRVNTLKFSSYCVSITSAVKKLILILLSVLLLQFHVTIHAEEELLSLDNFSGFFLYTSDYTFRGITNTSGTPGVQAQLGWDYDNYYLTVWGTETDFSTKHYEIVYTAGYHSFLQDLDLDFDAHINYATFPRDEFPGSESNFVETYLTVNKTLDLKFEPNIGVTWAMSPDYWRHLEVSHAVSTNLKLTLPKGTYFSAELGLQYISDRDGPEFDGYDYVWWNIGFSKQIGAFNLDLRYHDTDSSSTDDAALGELGEPRGAFTIFWSF